MSGNDRLNLSTKPYSLVPDVHERAIVKSVEALIVRWAPERHAEDTRHRGAYLVGNLPPEPIQARRPIDIPRGYGPTLKRDLLGLGLANRPHRLSSALGCLFPRTMDLSRR
jgi:hypothetical protein